MYEVFEWVLTLTMRGELAQAYNGQQGDPWDAQKDMALAAAGALMAAAAMALRKGRNHGDGDRRVRLRADPLPGDDRE